MIKKYIKTKVKTFDGVINTLFSDNEYIGINSILELDKKNYPQVHLQQCIYKMKRRKMIDFTDAEVGLSSNDSNDSK